MYKDQLLEKLRDKSALIGIFGLGYVGLPLALRFSHEKFRVVGFDVDANKVRILNAGQSYIGHISHSEISNAQANGFSATTEFSIVERLDALILCVPTPLTKTREPDLSFVVKTFEMLQPHLKAGQVISLESTTYPGTTEEELLTRLTESGMNIGEKFFLFTLLRERSR